MPPDPRAEPGHTQPDPFERFSTLLMQIASLVLLTMMLHVTADVLSKLFFNQPIPGTLEIVSYYYMVSAVFLPLALVELKRSSVAVDALFKIAPRPLRVGLILLVLVFSVVVYAGLAAITLPDAIRAFEHREVVMGPIAVPIWPARFVLPASCALSAFACLRLLFLGATDSGVRASLIASAEPDEAAIG